jgi:hypothetical protein
MRKLLTLLFATTLSLAAKNALAQSIVPTIDTIWTDPWGYQHLHNYLNITTSTPFTIDWKVVETNFPTDWLPLFQVCDNNNCYPSLTLLPIGGTGKTKTSLLYNNGLGEFRMTIDLTSAISYGVHYIRFKLSSNATTDTAVETFVFTRRTTGVNSVAKYTDDIVLYPNPANSELNVVFSANADIENMAVYNTVGQEVYTNHVSGNTANINLSPVPSGIYFLKLINSHGAVVATKRFTKQ